jgi:hypothetical protein
MLIEIEVRILHQAASKIFVLEMISVISLELEFSVPAYVVEVLGDGGKLVRVSRQNFDNRLRYTSNGA